MCTVCTETKMITVQSLLQELKEMGEDRNHALLRDLLVDNIVQNFDDASILTQTHSWRQHLVLQGAYPQDISAFASLVQAILSSHEEDIYEEVIHNALESIEEENEDEDCDD